MAKEEIEPVGLTKEKAEEEVLTEVKDEEEAQLEAVEKRKTDLGGWTPKTGLGNKVKNGEINDINFILDNGLRVLEPEIVDALVPGLETDLLMIGQSKGKFGGGQKRIFRQTQKKTKEGNKPHFATMAVVGNRNGFLGVGYGKSKETVPAREKAIRNAKLNLMKIRRGCGSWQCHCTNSHSIPFEVIGKCGSTKLKLMPAPKGTGLCVETECAKLLALAGIKDVWSKTYGQTRTKQNLIAACVKALLTLLQTKTRPEHIQKLNIVEGIIRGDEKKDSEGESS
jgi:small subunit ribosomal protein S5